MLRLLIGIIVGEASVAAFPDRPIGWRLRQGGSVQPVDEPAFREIERAGDWIDRAPVQAGEVLHLPRLSPQRRNLCYRRARAVARGATQVGVEQVGAA
jgi:hypothetical protein